MAFENEVKWEAGDWQMDRFNLAAKPIEHSAMYGAGQRLMGFFGAGPKNSNLCQVDNCTADVSVMKEYHSRYKICETHLKAKSAPKDGIAQRFCQQCGKFHPVQDFDGEKRSCRARLDKHNARRRRMREMAAMIRSTGKVDEAVLQAKYGISEDEIAPKVKKLQKSMMRKSGSGGSIGSLGGTPTHSAGGGVSNASGQTSGAQGFGMSMAGISGISQADLDLLGDGFLDDVMATAMPATSANPAGSAAATFLNIDPSTIMDLDDMTVLEELTREFGIDANVAAYSAANGISSGTSSGLAQAPMPPTLLVPTQQNVFLQQQQQQQQQQYRFSNFPFSAPPAAASSGPSVSATVTTGATTFSAMPPYMQQAMANAAALAAANGNPENPATVRSSTNSVNYTGSVATPTAAAGTPTVLDEALNMLAYDQSQVQHMSNEKLVRCSAKLFGCTPADLPSDLKSSLVDMLAVDGMEGYIRPGCVHLEINALVGPEEQRMLADGGMRAAVERFLAGSPDVAADGRMLVFQLGDHMAVVKDGQVQHVLSTAGAGDLVPTLEAVRPLAAPAVVRRGSAIEVQLWGYSMLEDDTVLARSKGRHLEAAISSIVSDPSWGGMQRVNVLIKGPLSPGCLQLEIMRGSFISASRAVLITSTPEEAAEVRTLEATAEGGDLDTLLFELGAVMEASSAHGGPAAAAAALASSPAQPGKTARRLLPFLVQRNWHVMTRAALNTAVADTSVSEAMSSVDVVAVGTTGMPLLQLAVRTQNVEMVALLLQWGRSAGHEFLSTIPGRRGLTALHLAALVRDDGAIAALITAACPDAMRGWDGTRAEDGSTPLGLATRYGTRHVVERIIAEQQYAKLREEGPAVSSAFASDAFKPFSDNNPMVEDVPSSSRLPVKAGITLHRLPSEYDDVALAKAACKNAALAKDAAMGPMLTFASPALESKYTAWYNAGQVPVDLAFMLIAILSQAAWVLRWSLGHSAVLGWSMMALIAFNSFYMGLAVLRPRAYVARREALCVMSLVVHKVVQMLVTVMPGVGTIYSPTYNATVALLESSSFAQIAMLSFGAKARVIYHAPALLGMLALSSTINSAICAAAWPNVPVALCAPAMFAFQSAACFALPCAAVYYSERRSRRIFLETAVA